MDTNRLDTICELQVRHVLKRWEHAVNSLFVAKLDGTRVGFASKKRDYGVQYLLTDDQAKRGKRRMVLKAAPRSGVGNGPFGLTLGNPVGEDQANQS